MSYKDLWSAPPLPSGLFSSSGFRARRRRRLAGLEAEEAEVDRTSKEYGRWLQTALNKALGTTLAVDGIIGPRTKAAIVALQTKYRFLPANGVVDLRTEGLLTSFGGLPPGLLSSFPWTSSSAPKVTIGSNAVVSLNAVTILEGILRDAGLTSATITSGRRTSADQARVMYNLIETNGVSYAKNLYGSNGDKVIDVYAAQKKAGKSATDIKQAMQDKIVALGPSNVSLHCSDTHDVIDVGPKSISDKAAFTAALDRALAAGTISRYIPPPKDPAFHIEIKLAAAGNEIFEAPPLSSEAFFGEGELEWEDSSTVGTQKRCLIFHGYPESAGSCSNIAVAKTLAKHLKKRFPGDDIRIICAWHKNTFLKELSSSQPGSIRQIHYCGHGSGGTLSFGYHHNDASKERGSLATGVSNVPDKEIAAGMALNAESLLGSGFFTNRFSIGAISLPFIRKLFTDDALMHVWGCFAGASTHTFDSSDAYWKLFNAGGSSVHGVARHIAETLQIPVTAARHTDHGMNYSHRDAKGKWHTSNRPCKEPHWLWPSKKNVQWVTYDRTGAENTVDINFLGTTIKATKIPGGPNPPDWLTSEIPVKSVANVAAASCSAKSDGT